MTTIVSQIKSGLETRIEATIPTYSKLSYQVDIGKNKFKGNYKGYSVLPSSASQTEGLVGSITLDHSFQLTLIDSYNQGGKSQISDELKASRISELNNDILKAYKDITVNKGLVDSSVLIISDLSINEAEFLEEEKVITISCNFNIKYKINT